MTKPLGYILWNKARVTGFYAAPIPLAKGMYPTSAIEVELPIRFHPDRWDERFPGKDFVSNLVYSSFLRRIGYNEDSFNVMAQHHMDFHWDIKSGDGRGKVIVKLTSQNSTLITLVKKEMEK